MIKFLIRMALWVIPLAFAITLDNLFAFLVGPDPSREMKEFLALGFALAIGLLGLYQGKIKAFENKWLLFLLGYLVLHVYMSPLFLLPILGSNAGSFWIYKPFTHILIYFLMLFTVSSLNFSSRDLKRIYQIISTVCLWISVYIIVQSLNMDQFKSVLPESLIGSPTTPHITGTFDNGTLVGAFLAVCLPFTLWCRRRRTLLITLVAIAVTQSQIAQGVALLCLLFYGAAYLRKSYIFTLISILGAILVVLMGYLYTEKPATFSRITSDSGRFRVWEQIINDLDRPPLEQGDKIYPITGVGLGSYRYIFVQNNQTTMYQAHNEYLEFLYNTGIAGVVLGGLAIFWLLKRVWPYIIDEQYLALLASFLAMCLCAAGTFVWQIEPTRFYSILILGLMHSKIKERNL